MIVDVGCGKGRSLNWLIDRFPAQPDRRDRARPGALRARRPGGSGAAPNVTIVCGDATELIPPEGTVFYLFNPFDEHA